MLNTTRPIDISLRWSGRQTNVVNFRRDSQHCLHLQTKSCVDSRVLLRNSLQLSARVLRFFSVISRWQAIGAVRNRTYQAESYGTTERAYYY